LLNIKNINKSFGGVVATDNVSLSFEEGSLSSIIGPNGAGKTTLFNLITGKIKPDSGDILLAGENITNLNPREIVLKGIGRAFQIANIFPTLTVKEALMASLASRLGISEKLFKPFYSKDLQKKSEELLDTLEMNDISNDLCSNISHGDQKVLDIGLALSLEPKVLMLDEPTAGMGPEERWQMVSTIERLWKLKNVTLIFIEHDMDIVFKISQKINVLRYGSLIESGNSSEIKNNKEVIDAYLGEDFESI
jgi:branched-chain amino acid transport system ATP-binding protein